MPRLDRIVFFGTPEFAVPSLEALVAADRRPLTVVTRPPRPAGRGRRLREPPVAERARERDLEVLQPESVKDAQLVRRLAEMKPDLFAVVAFGQIFPPELLEIPAHGSINVHASLLPKYRGAAPIQGAIAAGESKTGVTTQLMAEELDSGPILLQKEVAIDRFATTGELSETLAELGGELLVETIEKMEKDRLKPRKQRESSVSFAPRIEKSDGRVNWALEAEELYNRLRAYTPWPGCTAYLRTRPVKIVWAVPMTWEKAPFGEVGTILGLRQGRLAVLCGGDTILGLDMLQRPGKKALRAAEFVHGERIRVGERFA